MHKGSICQNRVSLEFRVHHWFAHLSLKWHCPIRCSIFVETNLDFVHVRPVSVLRRDALTSQLFRRPEINRSPARCYRDSNLTPRTNWSPWSGYEEFRRAVLSIQVSRNFTGASNKVDFGKAGRIVITREEWLSQQHAKSSPLFSTQYASPSVSQPMP